MAYQISDAILDTFEAAFDEIDSVEHGLQGACFAFGELARRGRIPDELVDRLVACALRVSVATDCQASTQLADGT